MRTITQVAEELVISRKRVYSLIQRLNIKTTKERLKNVLERDGYVTDSRISDR